jgi:hypothetical protein
MISTELNFAEFISAVKDKDKSDILRLAESEAIEAEKISQIKGYGQDYVEAVREFLYFIRYGQNPIELERKYFQMFRPVCENLVAKKQLLPDVLKMFDYED